jgi:hypothetical protein
MKIKIILIVIENVVIVAETMNIGNPPMIYLGKI